MKSVRTPPSLNWLIKKKARLMGEITRLEENLPQFLKDSEANLKIAKQRVNVLHVYHKNYEVLAEKVLPELKTQLEAINVALGIHDIQIDSNLINPIKAHEERAKFPYGSISRSIFEYFRIHKGTATTKEIALFIAAKFVVEENAIGFVKLTHMVSQRLNRLTAQGKINRLHLISTRQVGIWSMPT